MIVPQEMKLNKFRKVNLPNNMEYIKRFGLGQNIGNQYSGEETANFENRKTETTFDEKFLNEMAEKFQKETE